MRNFRQRKAFTIVEMVIVIAVIAVLAAVMIPTISGVIKKANHSADTQFAASLSMQLATWEADPANGVIDSEEKLREAMEAFYDADFYDTLAPKSGKDGYHYWYDVESKKVILATCDELNEVATFALGDYTFSPASPRSLILGGKNYFLMDKSGSEVLDALNGLTNVGSNDAYATAIDDLRAIEDGLAPLMADKLANTAVANVHGVFSGDNTDIYYVYVAVAKSDTPTALGMTQVKNGVVLTNVKEIQLPANVKVAMGSLTGFYNGEDTDPYKTATSEIHVNATEDELKDIFEAGSTDCVIVLPNGNRYVVEGNKIVKLPGTALDGELSVESIESITIKYSDANTTPKADADYYYIATDTLYLAYDIGNAQLTLADGLALNMVNWSVSEGAPITVENGEITIVGEPNALNTTATVTATLKADASKTDTIEVQIVFPTKFTWNLNGVEYSSDEQSTIPLVYTNSTNYAIASPSIVYVASGNSFVKMVNEPTLEFSTTGGLFNVVDGNLVLLDPDNIASYTDPQKLTVKCGMYLTAIYTINVEDRSTVALQPNLIVDQDKDGEFDEGQDTKIGDNYLFRVGNGNAIKLSDLFHAEKANKAVEIIDVTIFDKIQGADVEISKNQSDNFWGVYTSNTNWENATIQFGGTGVATIKVETSQGPATIAVEVVNGKNVTAGTYSSLSGNVVLLSDITLTGAFSYNNSTLYGNGFTIDATSFYSGKNGMITLNQSTLDHVNVIGNDYSTFTDSYDTDYYNSLIFINSGECYLLNSYFRGTRAPVWIKDGNVTLKDTVCDGGTYAALFITGGTKVVLDNITLKQEVRNGLIGAGILVNDFGVNTSIEITNGFTPYTWLAQSDVQKLPTVVRSTLNSLFGNSHSDYHHSVGGVTKINMGIIYGAVPAVPMPVYDGLSFGEIEVGNDVEIWTIKKNSGVETTKLYTVPGNELKTTYSGVLAQGATKPSYAFNTTDGYVANANNGTPYYQYNATDKRIDIAFEGGTSLTVDLLNATDETKRLTLTKYNVDLFGYVNVSVKDDSDNFLTVTNGKVTFNAEGVYTIVYSIDDGLQYDQNGDLKTGVSAHHEWEETIKVTTFSLGTKAADFVFAGFTGTTTESAGGKTYVMPDITTGTGEYGSLTVDGKTIYYPIVEGINNNNKTAGALYRYFPIFRGVTITDYDKQTVVDTYDTTTQEFPGQLKWESTQNLGGVIDKNGNYDIANRTAVPTYSEGNGGLYYSTKDINTSNGDIAETNAVLGFKYVGNNQEEFYYYIGFHFEKADKKTSICVTPDTLVTMADGAQKMIKDVKLGENVIAWNFYTGEYEIVPVSLIQAHETGYLDVLYLHFEDGTELKVLGEHGIYDADLNTFIFIDQNDVDEYVGHNFVKQDGDGFATTKLVGYEVVNEYTTAYTILSYAHYNVLLEGMFTVTPAHIGGNFFNPFEVNADMKYDEEQMQADIEKYGLYTYEDFADYVTYEQFEALKLSHFKVSVGKGLVTYDGLVYLLEAFVNNEDFDVNN